MTEGVAHCIAHSGRNTPSPPDLPARPCPGGSLPGAPWAAFFDRKFLILDRDNKFTALFRSILEDAGVAVMRPPFRAPNMNAIAERFVQSVKRECLERLILFGPGHLRRALKEFVAHYRIDRPHQGLGNRVLTASASEPLKHGDVVADERIGGLLRSYRRSA
ncbi:MAG: transposase [Planctomycetes bacterium]|nr:transposase [Planctomycetota bacterium]